MGRVVVVGSLNVDHIAHVEERHAKPGETRAGHRDYRAAVAGGKGANQAVAAARARGRTC
jgi:ribokinase